MRLLLSVFSLLLLVGCTKPELTGPAQEPGPPSTITDPITTTDGGTSLETNEARAEAPPLVPAEFRGDAG